MTKKKPVKKPAKRTVSPDRLFTLKQSDRIRAIADSAVWLVEQKYKLLEKTLERQNARQESNEQIAINCQNQINELLGDPRSADPKKGIISDLTARLKIVERESSSLANRVAIIATRLNACEAAPPKHDVNTRLDGVFAEQQCLRERLAKIERYTGKTGGPVSVDDRLKGLEEKWSDLCERDAEIEKAALRHATEQRDVQAFANGEFYRRLEALEQKSLWSKIKAALGMKP